MFRTALTILGAFACGAVVAAIVVSRPILPSNDAQPATASAPVAATPSPPPASSPVSPAVAEPAAAPERPQPRVIPLDRSTAQSPAPDSQTTGTGDSERVAGSGQRAANSSIGATSSCNQNACARAYHSFDGANCTYQPSKGGPRRLCTK